MGDRRKACLLDASNPLQIPKPWQSFTLARTQQALDLLGYGERNTRRKCPLWLPCLLVPSQGQGNQGSLGLAEYGAGPGAGCVIRDIQPSLRAFVCGVTIVATARAAE
jgi:hypothetical protein